MHLLRNVCDSLWWVISDIDEAIASRAIDVQKLGTRRIAPSDIRYYPRETVIKFNTRPSNQPKEINYTVRGFFQPSASNTNHLTGGIFTLGTCALWFASGTELSLWAESKTHPLVPAGLHLLSGKKAVGETPKEDKRQRRSSDMIGPRHEESGRDAQVSSDRSFLCTRKAQVDEKVVCP